MSIAFLDIETTGLDPLKHEILEVGIILRHGVPSEPAEVIHFSLPIDLTVADEKALEINKFAERRIALQGLMREPEWAKEMLARRLDGALVVGNNVQFDLRFIEQFLGEAPWYYSPLDLKAFVAGRCGMRQPASTKLIAEVAGVPIPTDAHTALVDANWNRRVYDALVG